MKQTLLSQRDKRSESPSVASPCQEARKGDFQPGQDHPERITLLILRLWLRVERQMAHEI